MLVFNHTKQEKLSFIPSPAGRLSCPGGPPIQEDSPVEEGLLHASSSYTRRASATLLLQSGERKHGNRVCHRELKICRSQHPKPACIVLQIRIFLSLTDAWIPRSHFGFRCWCSHGQKRPVAHLENVPEQKRFRVDALDLYLSGDLSGKRAERLFRHAELAGTAHISDVGKPEGSKNSHRDLLRKALQNSLWPKTYETEVRGWNPKSGTVEPMMLAYYLPHEMMHAMLLVNGAEDMLALQEQTLASTLDLREHLREFCNQFRLSDVLALGLWLDGVPFNSTMTGPRVLSASL